MIKIILNVNKMATTWSARIKFLSLFTFIENEWIKYLFLYCSQLWHAMKVYNECDVSVRAVNIKLNLRSGLEKIFFHTAANEKPFFVFWASEWERKCIYRVLFSQLHWHWKFPYIRQLELTAVRCIQKKREKKIFYVHFP